MERGMSRYGSYCRLRFDGEMTSEAVEEIKADWLDKLKDCIAVEIDLSGAKRIDLHGVQLMLQLREQAKRECKLILFVGWNPVIDEALHVYQWFMDLIGNGYHAASPVMEGGVA